MAIIGTILGIIAAVVGYYLSNRKAKERKRREDIARMDAERRAIADGDSDAASVSHVDRMRRLREFKNRRAAGRGED